MRKELIEQTKYQILQYLTEKGLQVGDNMPPIRQLMAVLHISKNAALEAIQVLCADGILKKGAAARNGFDIRVLPRTSGSSSAEKALVAQFLLPFNTWNYVGNQFLIHVEKEFSSHKGNLILSNTENSVAIEHQQLRTFWTSQSPRPDILLLMPSKSVGNPNIELLRLVQQDVPVMLVDRTIRDFSCRSVSINNRFVGIDAVNRLWARGNRCFAFASGFSSISPVQERLSGYLEALREHDCAPEQSRVFLDPDMDMGGYHKIRVQVDALGRSILALNPRPTCVVCGSDRIATCLVNFFIAKGLSVPDDMAVIGCDGDSAFSEFCKVPLCSYRQPFSAMAQYIYKATDDILTGRTEDHFYVEFMPEYIEGKSL